MLACMACMAWQLENFSTGIALDEGKNEGSANNFSKEAAAKKLDEPDTKTILELQEDARARSQDIGNKLRVPEDIAGNRVTRLLEEGILKLQARADFFARRVRGRASESFTLKKILFFYPKPRRGTYGNEQKTHFFMVCSDLLCHCTGGAAGLGG